MSFTTVLDEQINCSLTMDLGKVARRADIRSSVGPISFLPEYKAFYPRVVIEALGDLYEEYNRAFISSVELNREWKTDYQYCLRMRDSMISPVNFAVQIDMVGLPDGFLREAEAMSREEVRELLRGRIYEIENSLAMYQLLEKVFADSRNESFFNTQFRVTLDKLRKKFKKPIALLAVTEQKYAAMKVNEFGKLNGQIVSDEETRKLSGFDRFFGPDDFRQYLEENNGRCEYLLYARTSDPVDKLKDPKVRVEHQLLNDPEIRRIIKANVLTFNIDAPEMDVSRRINDTKTYQVRMGMGFPVSTEADLYSLEFSEHMFAGRKYEDFTGRRLSREFSDFLTGQGLDAGKVESGEIMLRGKPMKGAYGCYGHVSGPLSNGKFRRELRRGLSQRDGGYVIQVEMAAPVITNLNNDDEYTYIDRVFFAFTGKNPHFMGGFRALMPTNSNEAKHGRNHGNGRTVWAEISV